MCRSPAKGKGGGRRRAKGGSRKAAKKDESSDEGEEEYMNEDESGGNISKSFRMTFDLREVTIYLCSCCTAEVIFNYNVNKMKTSVLYNN